MSVFVGESVLVVCVADDVAFVGVFRCGVGGDECVKPVCGYEMGVSGHFLHGKVWVSGPFVGKMMVDVYIGVSCFGELLGDVFSFSGCVSIEYYGVIWCDVFCV